MSHLYTLLTRPEEVTILRTYETSKLQAFTRRSDTGAEEEPVEAAGQLCPLHHLVLWTADQFEKSESTPRLQGLGGMCVEIRGKAIHLSYLTVC